MCVEYLININLTIKNITLSSVKDISSISTKFFYYSNNFLKIEIIFKKYVFIFLIYILPSKEREKAINYLHSAHKQKALKPKIDSIFRFEDCDRAQDRTLIEGRKGAVLLEI